MQRIIHKVKGWIKGTPASRAGHVSFVYVLNPPKQGPVEISSDDQLAILRRLSSFAGKEDVRVTAVFPGKPTRKIPDGASSSGVSVRYATAEQLQKVVEQVSAEYRKQYSVVVATDDPAVEKKAHSSHMRTLRLSTFEKTLDAVAGPVKREQRDQREPRRSQQPQRTSPRPAQPQAPDAGSEQTQTPRVGEEPKPQPPPQQAPAHKRQEPPKQEKDSAILDLIDPL